MALDRLFEFFKLPYPFFFVAFREEFTKFPSVCTVQVAPIH